MGILDAPGVPLTIKGQQALATQRTVALRKFHAAVANRNLGRCSIAMIGDSLTQGQGATLHTRTMPARLAANLRSRYPQTATGGRGYIAAVNGGNVGPYTWPCVLSGSPSTGLPGWGPARASTIFNSAPKFATFTLQGTSADLVYPKFSGGGVGYYTVDGGGATTFSVSKTGSLTDGNLLRVTLGASGAHTLVVGWSSGGNVAFDGVIEYDGDETAGIMVHNCGWSGSKTSDWASATDPEWAQGLAALAPDLIIMELGVNDANNAVAVATFQANMTALIATMRAALTTPYPPIVLDAVWGWSAFSAATWATYVNAMYAIAAADSGVIVFDETLRFNYPIVSYTDASMLGLLADGVHRSDHGDQAVADSMTAFVAPV